MKILQNCTLVFKLVFRYAPWNALLLILGFYIPGFFGGLQIILVQRVVDAGLAYAAGGGQLENVVFYGVLLVIMLFFWVILQRLAVYETKVLDIRLAERLSPDIMEKLTNLEYAAFEQKGTQEVLQRISSGQWNKITKCFQRTVVATQAVVSMVFMLIVYMSISVWIGLGLLLIAVPMVTLSFMSARRRNQLYYDTTEEKRRMSDVRQLLRNKHAMYEMKVFGAQKLLNQKWNLYSENIINATRKTGRQLLLMNAGSCVLSLTYFIFIVVTLAYSLLHGTVTLGQFTAALSTVGALTSKMNNSSWGVAEMFRLILEMDFYQEFLKLPERTDRRAVDSILHRDIAFENVSFTYPGTDRQVLNNVTFHIKEGERVAFVGENGA